MPLTKDNTEVYSIRLAVDVDEIEFVEDGTISQGGDPELPIQGQRRASITDREVPGRAMTGVSFSSTGAPSMRITGRPDTSIQYNVEETFNTHLDRWRSETAFHSSMDIITNNPWYQEIVDMGERAIPFILHELQEEPKRICYALFDITNENPVPPEDHGDLEAISKAWLEWGQRNGYL